MGKTYRRSMEKPYTRKSKTCLKKDIERKSKKYNSDDEYFKEYKEENDVYQFGGTDNAKFWMLFD